MAIRHYERMNLMKNARRLRGLELDHKLSIEKAVLHFKTT